MTQFQNPVDAGLQTNRYLAKVSKVYNWNHAELIYLINI